ncbi:hypothetical protein [Stenotrophomonas hibiscicola]|uniref:hypothetical protein n=1 Tax=Stenotrophomonas hibiscicola TaxID=86189 RepID=UPI002E77BB09|nr:hypothetical protein [[Pseudomonas] hibiscicola]
MLSFATDFPVAFGTAAADFLAVVRKWIVGSPHAELNSEDLCILETPGRGSVERGRAKLDCLLFKELGSESAAIRYVIQDGNIQWMTMAAYSKAESDVWVSVRTSCESMHASVMLPPAKKPILVQLLINELARGDDAGLVLGNPIWLSNSDVSLATDLILGRAKNRMPVVYVSSSFSGGRAVSVQQLGWKLTGVAHLVVEPSRAFSNRLRNETGSENVFGGSIGIYWPDGGGRPSQFRRSDYSSGRELEDAIDWEVRTALVNRRPLERCTFSTIDSAISRVEIDLLKKLGDKGFDEYAAHFDVELQAKQEALDLAEREISRLKSEVKDRARARSPVSGITFATGVEQDFYDGEILDFVLQALKDSLDRIPEGTRKRHVIEAIIAANAISGGAAGGREKLKEVMRGYRSLDRRTRQALEEIGFSVDHFGKHPRVVFQDDERYAYVLPSSGSDHRGGLNAATAMAKLVF